MSSKIKTYNPKEVIVTCGTHIVTGYADDSFISIEPNGDGITKKTGCDGEIARSISPDNTYKVKLTLLQTSDSNSYFSGMVDLDRDTGNGLFPILIKDLKGRSGVQHGSCMVREESSCHSRQRDQQP